MFIKGKLNKFDLFLLQEAINYGDHGCNIVARVGASHLTGAETVKVHSEGWGDWYLLGGHCMWWALVQANSWEDAFYIYLEEFVPADDMPEDTPEGRAEAECGTWDDNGNWYSESTTAYVTGMDTANFDEWEIEITPREGVEGNE